jgi:hypothetical protein
MFGTLHTIFSECDRQADGWTDRQADRGFKKGLTLQLLCIYYILCTPLNALLL